MKMQSFQLRNGATILLFKYKLKVVENEQMLGYLVVYLKGSVGLQWQHNHLHGGNPLTRLMLWINYENVHYWIGKKEPLILTVKERAYIQSKQLEWETDFFKSTIKENK